MCTTAIIIKISGMTGSTCAQTVENLIIDERGVEKVSVSWENGTVEVFGKQAMNKDNILNAVNLSGAYHAE